MRRFGLPRWARAARPRVIKAPAPPSLLSIIRTDQAWELQQRVCKTGSVVMMEVGYSEDFWEKQWPRLVRQSCENLSQKCLNLLLMISPQYGDKRRPLPPQTLAWLVKGLEADSIHRSLSSLDTGLCDALLRELSANPIQLRAEDGLRLLRVGGYRSVFYINRQSDQPQAIELEHADSFRSAWHTWCASKSNREQVLELIGNKDATLGRFASGTQMFEEVVLEMPRQHRAAYLGQMCDVLQRTILRPNSPQDVRNMNKWHYLFLRSSWNMDHPVWAAWGNTLCRALETAPEKSWLGEEVTSLMVANRSEFTGQEALPGWSWTPAMREGFVRSRVHVVQDLLERQEHDSFISDQHLAQAGTFFRQTVQAETALERWGLLDNSARQHMDTLLDQALGERWQERLDAVIYDNPQQDAAPLQRAWTTWKGRHLELDWSESVTPTRARPRM